MTGPSGAGQSLAAVALALPSDPSGRRGRDGQRLTVPCWKTGRARREPASFSSRSATAWTRLVGRRELPCPAARPRGGCPRGVGPRRRFARSGRPGRVPPSSRRPALRWPAAAGGAGEGFRPAPGRAARRRVDQRPGRRQPGLMIAALREEAARGARSSSRLTTPKPQPRPTERSRWTRVWLPGSARCEGHARECAVPALTSPPAARRPFDTANLSAFSLDERIVFCNG